MTKTRMFFVLVLCQCFFSISYAAVCKTTDADGNTLFKQCSSSESAGKIKLNYHTPSEDNQTRLQKMKKYLSAFQEERDFEKAQRAKEKQTKKERHAACHTSMKKLEKIMENGYLWYETDENYNRVYLTEEQIIESRKNLYKKVLKNCGSRYIPDNAKKMRK